MPRLPTSLIEKPEVLSGHTDIICSNNIDRIICGRQTALMQIEQALTQLHAVSELTQSIGGGGLQDWGTKSGHRFDSLLVQPIEETMRYITRQLDRSLWQDLMNRSGMLTLMDSQARKQWYDSLESQKIPAISEDTIYGTFKQLHNSKIDVFECGVINVFKGLSWDYKTNSPCRFGKKIILNGLVSYNRWGFTMSHGYQRDRLADLERMLYLLDGKTIPDHRGDITTRLYQHIQERGKRSEPYKDKHVEIRYYMKGTGHLFFKRMDLVEKLNDIIAKNYPGMLAER